MTVHSDNRPFKCDICNLGFKRKRTMQDHRKTHTHSHEFKCDQDGCDKAFRKKISLIRHLEYHSGSICRPFICDFCGKGFRLNANLVVSTHIHHQYTFPCWNSLILFVCSLFRNTKESTQAKNRIHVNSNLVRKPSEQCPVFIVI